MTRYVSSLSCRKTTRWLLVLAMLLGSSPAAWSQLKSSPEVLEAFATVVARPSESTTRVLCDGRPVALGTVVGADGWILTKASELKGKGAVSCRMHDGKTLPAKVWGIEEKTDLALLKVDARGLKPIEWRESKSAEVGNWVVSPGDQQDPVAVGVVSVATRKVSPADLPPRAVPANAGYLGVGLERGPQGPKIGMISPRSPAARAGLKVGDLVLKIAGKEVKDPGGLVDVIQTLKAGNTITLEVKRGDEVMEFKAKLSRRPAELDRASMQNNMGSKLSDRRNGFPIILQHDQVIKPTDCGGPLVGLDGKAVGVNIARAGRVESYAIPSETVQTLLGELKSGKLAPKPETLVAVKNFETLENALKKARAEKLALEQELREMDDEGVDSGSQRKTLEERLSLARKKVADALAALEKAKKDPTKN